VMTRYSASFTRITSAMIGALRASPAEPIRSYNGLEFFDHSVLQRRKGREVARSEEESRRKAV
jgi:hypothetical protein